MKLISVLLLIGVIIMLVGAMLTIHDINPIGNILFVTGMVIELFAAIKFTISIFKGKF
jgi:hypothetical protein